MSSELQLPKPNIPRIPFSSPIPEDTLSPTHLTFSHLGQPWRRRHGGEAKKDQMDSRYDDQAHRLSPFKKPKPLLEDIPIEQRSSSSRSRLPELNLVTNFSKSPLRPADSGNRNNQRGRTQEQIEGISDFVTESEALKERSGGTSFNGETLLAKDPASGKQIRLDGMKGPVGSLRRSNSKAMEISPSDRTLVIGISIPSSKLSEYATSPESAAVGSQDSMKDLYGGHRHNQTIPDTFSVPGHTATSRLAVPDTAAPWKRRRAASSVYSQATLYARGVSVMADVPPMPPLPLPTTRHAHEHYPSDDEDGKLVSRVTSWETKFDEEEKQQRISYPRPYSGDSRVKMINRSSIDTTATRHRSQGWWNHILSPFLTRSNTLLTKHSPTDEEDRPPMPHISQQSKDYPFIAEPEASNSSLAKQIHPETTLNRQRSGRSSIWTDLSRWDAERRTTGFCPEDIKRRSLEPYNSARDSSAVMSPDFEPFSGLGAAAEYFEASWHDQNSPAPFFKCENHKCLTGQSLMQNQGTTRNLYESCEEQSPEARPDEKGIFNEIPSNRFSTALSEARSVKKRPKSDITEIEEDLDYNPEVQKALVAPMVRAGSPIPAVQRAQPESDQAVDKEPHKAELQSMQGSAPRQPLYSSQKAENSVNKYQAGLPLENPRNAPEPPAFIESPPQDHQPVLLSEPAKDSIPLTDLPRDFQLRPAQNTYRAHQFNRYPELDQDTRLVTETNQYSPPPQASDRAQNKWEMSEKKDKAFRDSREKNESRSNSCWSRVRSHGKKKERRLYCCILSGLMVMIILILVLALTLTRKRRDIPVQSSFLNITGYPPIPTGVSTVARPDAALEESGCVQPSTMWSCALPKEQHALVAPNDPDQPNFRIEIRFENSTTASSNSSSQMGRRTLRQSVNAVSARHSFTAGLYTPNPAPPSQQDQVFLGNTTDGNVTPFDGEITPFFISLLVATPVSTQLVKRQDSNSTNSTDPFPDVTGTIPAPDLNPDGTAAVANLLPFPSNQPLRLFNRGLDTEHYGFYNYFDRSIFLKSTALIDTNSTSVGEVPDDENGGSPEDAATVRCTWAQTRFLVQIWTNKSPSMTLLPNTNTMSPTSTTSSATAAQTGNLTTSSANDFSRPGSFPYPISITLDRHGGNLHSKEIYCYGLDNREHVITGEKKLQLENRSFDGTLVNPALGPFGNVNVSLADGGPGGIDGGSGGCGCQWRNWEANS